MALEHGPIQKRRRVDEPDQRFDGPSLHERELEQPFVREPRSAQHQLVRIPFHGLLPPLRHTVAGADSLPPTLERVVQDTVPPTIAAPWRPTPQERDTAAFGEAGNDAPRNGITIEPVERVSDRDDVEGSLERHVLGRRGNPPDVRDSETLRFALTERGRLRLL